MAAWRFFRSGWLYQVPLTILLSFEVALLVFLGLGWPTFLALLAIAGVAAIVPLFLRLAPRSGDPVTERAVIRSQNRNPPWRAA
jgi:hypothetical protein